MFIAPHADYIQDVAGALTVPPEAVALHTNVTHFPWQQRAPGRYLGVPVLAALRLVADTVGHLLTYGPRSVPPGGIDLWERYRELFPSPLAELED